MTQSVNFGQLVDPQQEEIQRQRAYAQALRQQANEPIQQQVVSGRVVPISWTQGLANMLKAYTGRKLDEEADQKQRMYMDTKRAQAASDAQGFIAALRGTPGQTFQTGANEMGDEAATQNIPAQAPDMNKALAIALRSENPMIQGMGGSVMASMLPKAAKWEKVEKPNADGSKQVGFVDVNSPTPWSTFTAGGTAPVKREYVNGQGLNPFTGETQGPAIPRQLAPDSVVTMGPNGQLAPNAPVIAAKSQIAAAGKPVTNVSVNTANKPMLTEIGKGVGEQVISDFGGARSAVQVLNNVEQMRQGLGNAILGPGASARVKLGQIGQVLGVNGKDSTEQLQNTRMVMQGLARQELAAAQGMKGQGQITEAERAILRRAESGQIDELTKPEVETLLNALTKTANYRMNIHKQNLERLKRDPNAAGVVDYMNVQPPSGAPKVSNW